MIVTRKQTVIGTVVLALVAFAGNMTSLPLFFGVDLIFGSIATIIAAMLLGTLPAAIVGASGGVYTMLLWGHPYALVIFTAEAILVARLYHRYRLNPVTADALFWLLVGAPLIYNLYGITMGLPHQAVNTLLLKQPLNGVFNALMAGIIVLLARLTGATGGLLSGKFVTITDILFYAFFSLVLVAGAVPIIYEASSQHSEAQTRMAQTLGEDNRRLIAHLDDRRLEYHRYWTTQNRNTLAQAMLIKDNRALLETGHLKSLSGQGQFRPIDEHFGVWLPPGDMSQIQRWRKGRYVRRDAVEHDSDITTVVSELPAAPLVNSLQAKYVTLFTILSVILLLGVITSIALSRWLAVPIRALTTASQRLDQKIAGDERIELPSSNIIEFQQLSETLRNMSQRLSQNVAALRESRQAVQQTVEERTRELDETARLLRSVLEAATEFGIIATDPDGRIIVFNSGAEQLLGYSASELHDSTPMLFHDPQEIPEPFSDSPTDENVTPYHRVVARAAEHGLDAREWTYLRKDGTRIPVWLTITPIYSDEGEIKGYLGIAEDITERKRLDRMKNEFIATVSHELRTPLTSIAGALGLITQGATGELPAKAGKMADIAYRNTQHLSALVNDLLDMEKLVSGKVRISARREDILPIIHETVENHGAFADQNGVVLETQGPKPPLFANVDAKRLNQALSNLLSNAIKFSPSGERVLIDINEDADGIAIRVQDRGPGIPEHFHHQIFQRFGQANKSDSRQQPGTGLGLAITRELMTQMGGSVGFESVEGKGSTFWLWLPKQ